MANEKENAFAMLAFLAFLYLVFILSVYPHIERFMRGEPPETTLAGSDRGSYRDYWGAPEIYDEQTDYKCACYKKNRFYREGKCCEFYKRGGTGLGFNGKKPCFP